MKPVHQFRIKVQCIVHVLGVVKITRAKPFFEDEISDAYLINPIFKEKASKDADLFLRRHEFI